MTLQFTSTESTWAKPRVLPVTDRPVTTLISTQQTVLNDAALARFIPVAGGVTFSQIVENAETFCPSVQRVEVPAISPIKPLHSGALATVIQIWEGIVLSVDLKRNVMTVKLTDRSGLIGAHTADIELQWVADQDRDLLREGAVFYWTLYKETRRGSISNSQDIRFRRLPSWNKAQLAIMKEEARELSAKFSTTSRIAD